MTKISQRNSSKVGPKKIFITQELVNQSERPDPCFEAKKMTDSNPVLNSRYEYKTAELKRNLTPEEIYKPRFSLISLAVILNIVYNKSFIDL